MSENPVEEAIRKAQEMAAKAAVPAAVAPVAQGTVMVPVATKAPSLVALTQGSMSVDGFVKVKENHLLLMGKPNMVESIKVAITPSQMQPFTGVRYMVGQTANYLKTYDGVTCSTGGSWADAVAKAQSIDPKARPYDGADISMRLLEDAKDMKGAVVAEAGQTLGHSTSITNKAEVAAFLKEAMDAGIENDELEVEVSFKPRVNKAGNTWGVLTFKILSGPVAE